MGPVETYSALLQSYLGRDKVLRTASYACILLTGVSKGKTAVNLTTFATQISSARTILRLFDDVPMWTVTRTWGVEEKDFVSRICTALGNLAIQVYYPFEKIAWLADHSILSLESKPWWDAGVAAWAIYLVFNIIKGIRTILLLQAKRARVAKQRKLESPDKSGEKDMEFRSEMKSLGAAEIAEYWTLVKNLADFVMAFNWLPLNGLLWSGKLSPVRSAFFGCISSVIGLYQNVQKTKALMEKTAKSK